VGSGRTSDGAGAFLSASRPPDSILRITGFCTGGELASSQNKTFINMNND
jgi:hypothetical protein